MYMPKPKISVNKLGEYLQTNPQRRKTIIYDMNYPKSYKVARYIEAKEAIKNYFISNFDEEVLNASIYAHEAKKPESEFQEQDKQLSSFLSTQINTQASIYELISELSKKGLIDKEVKKTLDNIEKGFEKLKTKSQKK